MRARVWHKVASSKMAKFVVNKMEFYSRKDVEVCVWVDFRLSHIYSFYAICPTGFQYHAYSPQTRHKEELAGCCCRFLLFFIIFLSKNLIKSQNRWRKLGVWVCDVCVYRVWTGRKNYAKYNCLEFRCFDLSLHSILAIDMHIHVSTFVAARIIIFIGFIGAVEWPQKFILCKPVYRRIFYVFNFNRALTVSYS